MNENKDQYTAKLNPSVMSNFSGKPGGIKKGFLFAFIFTIGMSSFQFGYSIGVFNTMQDDFTVIFNWDNDQASFYSSLITSICSFGSAIGAIGIGAFTKFGKKNCIFYCNFMVFVGAGLTLVENIPCIIVGRFIFGLASGTFSVLVPGFINELCPTELKGPVGTITQILITVGIMISYFLGLPIPDFPSEPEARLSDSFLVRGYWRIMFALPIAISLIQNVLLMSVFNYETPKYLKQKNQVAQLNKLMGKIYESDRVNERINEIVVEKSGGGASSSPGYGATLCHPKYQMATLVGCLLSFLQQFSGINAVMFYSSKIFVKIGITAKYGTAIVGFVNCISTLGSIPLLGKFGRKTILWTLSFVMAIDLVGLGVVFFYVDESNLCKVLAVVFVCLFVMIFEFSLGPIPWIYMSEIMTDKGLSIAVLINWLLTLLMAIVTPYVIGGALFIVFGAFCVVCALFSLFVLKETKGLSDAEVSKLYSREKQTNY